MSGRCSNCIIRGFLVEGDESMLPDFVGFGPPRVGEWFSENPEEAFRQLHDQQRIARLHRAGLANHHFVAALTKEADAMVARRGGSLLPHERSVAVLLAASVGGLMRGQAVVMQDLPAEQRRAAVAAMAEGRFDAVRGLEPGVLVGLAAQPQWSRLPANLEWFSRMTAKAVLHGLERASDGGGSAVAKLNVCLVHAAACIGDDGAFELDDLATAAGMAPGELGALVEEVRGRAKPMRVLRPGTGTCDIAVLNDHPHFVRARQWLGVELDPRALEVVRQLGTELASVSDPWVRWAYRSAMAGPTADRMLSLLVDRGEQRRERTVILSEARRRGVLAGESARQVLHDEASGVMAGRAELNVFTSIFEQELELSRPPALADFGGLGQWYERALTAYFAGASSLGNLPPVEAVLLPLAGQADLPDWLRVIVARLDDDRWNDMRLDAQRYGRQWLVDLVAQEIPERQERSFVLQLSSLLADDDRAVLRDFASRVRERGNPPWYALDLSPKGPGLQFRLMEAAFECRLIPEAQFRDSIVQHSRPIWSSPALSPEDRERARKLCERCGRFMLKRLIDAEPRRQTLDAFRRADVHGMLASARIEASGLPYRSVPTQVISPVAAAGWIAASLLVAIMVADLWLGGRGGAPAAAVAPATGIKALESRHHTLDKNKWKVISGASSGGTRLARLFDERELAELVPGSAPAAGNVAYGWAQEFADRFGDSLRGPGSKLVVPGGRAIDPGKVTIRLPSDASEAMGFRPWMQADAEDAVKRKPVVLVLEYQEAGAP
jgi:hypothetical protein